MEQPTNTPPTPVSAPITAVPPVSKPETIVSSPGNGQSQLWIYVMIIIILVMLAVGGYFLYQSMMLNSSPSKTSESTQNSPAPSTETVATPEATLAPTPEQELNSLTIEDPSDSFTEIDKDIESIK